MATKNPGARRKTNAPRSRANAATSDEPSASRLISARIAELADWRGDVLKRIRALIKQADRGIVEEWKWRGTPVWSHNGIVCTGESYKNIVKLTFVKGAQLADPARLFNASLEGNARRAIDIHEGEMIDEPAFKDLIRAAVALNVATDKAPARRPAQTGTTTPAETPKRGKAAVLLSGGNPQIAKASGDAPVQAYIRAMPGWKRDVGRRLDAVITRNVPGVRKAVKWNSPFYGIEDRGWLVSFHVFTRYVKVTFFNGASLRPAPPGGTDKDARWIDIHEDDLDDARMTKWVKQAAKLPGWGRVT